MRNLLDFIQKYHYIFLFVLLEVISFTLLFRYNSYQGSVWFSSANTAVATVDRAYADAVSYVHLGKNNQELTQQIVQLQVENELLRNQLQAANIDVRIADSLTQIALNGYERMPAVVTSNGRGSDNLLVIDRGKNDGVRPEMGVISGAGVVGVTYLCGSRYSLVIPVTNKNSNISCRIRGQKDFGFLQWEQNQHSEAYVDDIPRYAKVKVGDQIETSGYSAVFPPGIFVGTVKKIENAPDGQSFRLRIALGTSFDRLRYVTILTTPYKAELDSLKSAAKLLDDQQNK